MRGGRPGSDGDPSGGTPAAAVRLRLLDGFGLEVCDGPVDVAPGAQRLVAFLALRNRPVLRSMLAGHLWSEVGEGVALSCLRSALWRLRQRCPHVVESQDGNVRLGSEVAVDVRELEAHTGLLLDPCRVLAAGDEDPRRLCCDLLPGWWEDWVIVERERLRQRRLHALESLAERLAAEKRFVPALDAALAAVDLEPLRESPHRAVIGIHLEEGNRSEALRCYGAYRDLLRRELGVEPSPRIEALIATVRPPPVGSALPGP